MQKRELDELKKKLEERRIEIVRQLENFNEAISFLEESRPPEFSEEAQEEAASISLKALNEQEHRELILIWNALQKIKKGEYGICEDCSKPIENKRLHALPMVQYCIKCQTRLETEAS